MSESPEAGRRALYEADLIEVGTPQRVVTSGMPPLCIVRLADADGGGWFVVDDTCSHGQASLADGFVEGDEIECPFHSGKFCVRDGRATAMPADAPIRVYPARVIDGQVCIDADAASA